MTTIKIVKIINVFQEYCVVMNNDLILSKVNNFKNWNNECLTLNKSHLMYDVSLV